MTRGHSHPASTDCTPACPSHPQTTVVYPDRCVYCMAAVDSDGSTWRHFTCGAGWHPNNCDDPTEGCLERVKARLVTRQRELEDALRRTNEEIIAYGTSPEEYDWKRMLQRTQANARLLGDR